jgi:HAMP domain-containing protein/CheY-like chemotaxis protein/signal transduction histidine kinase
MATQITSPAGDAIDRRLLLQVLTAVKNGDFAARLPVEWTGIDGKIADTFNGIVALNEAFAKETSRASRVVGREGKISHRLDMGRVDGAWASQAECLNALIADLTMPTSEMARVIGAVAKGDLNQSVSLEADNRPLQGEFLRAAKAVNAMVQQLGLFTAEVTRVAREVGTEGKLGGQAQVKGVSGTWKDLTESVNLMASNLTAQVRNIADVTVSVANGDLSKKITVDVRGEFLQLKDTMNTMVDQLRGFASEVTRVAREVGTDGKLGGQAVVPGVGGVWKDLTDNVNGMAANLTAQVRNLAEVTTSIAKGDLTRKITVEVKGEMLELKNTVNTMVEQLNSFTAEVTRVAREVGTDGKLGGQADVQGVAGTWRDLTENVNGMAANLTGQVRNIAQVTTAVANGDLGKKITVDARGEILELKDTINTMVDQLNSFASEVTRVAREVGSEGKLGGQADVRGVGGTWKDLTDNVNGMAANLTGQVRNIADVTTAVANGDLNRKITVDAKGEILELKDTINTMVDQLNSFASEVTRVAREVGSEGKLGGQADVRGVGGTWKDLTDNVNGMAANLTGQVRNIADVTTAVANGDLTRKITVDAKGEILELKDTINTMVEQLGSFASEVTRVAREVGTDGQLGGQAEVKGVGGTWKDLTDNVNFMAANLTGQVRNIADVTTAVANGDLNRKITVDAKGEILELKDTINTMVEQLSSFASEVTRVAREVGTDGKLGGQAVVKGVAGTWKDLTDNVNFMAANLTGQVRNIAEVTTAVANGDLNSKITVDARGEILELKNTVNAMVDRLNSFAAEVTRVAREVGSDGKLGGQADVKGVGGTWKDLTDNVNFMATNLTDQVRNIAAVTTAVANGDLTRKITVDARGEILELKDTINTMVERLNSFAAEVTRVAREVGTDGKLGGQADVKGVAGTWKDLTDNVNFMAANLTGQVRNIADVTTAVANGELNSKITVDAKGEILELKDTINTMVEQLSSFASEVTRVAREVGTDGKLGGQAEVKGVGGTWKDLTDNVNFMAANLTGQVRNIADVTTAVANGQLNRKITVDAKGEILDLKSTINTMVEQLSSFAAEVTRVAREVGTEGKLGGQAQVRGVSGTWKDLTDNVNSMAANLTDQVRGIAAVTTAVARGDLAQKITVDAKGEILELKSTVNTMVDQLNSFASEVTRVAREVGTEGKLGGQAQVRGVSGTWKDLTDNVNSMAANLTDQVRGIAKVVTAVAVGDLRLKLSVFAKGEIATLADTINSMIDTLATFAEQVTGVAREVGVEGKLGGQANVPGAAGTWKDLTDNVNRLAANLTTQVRAIADVSTAVTKGDLSRSIDVEAAGEVALLKDNVNEMIRNLKATTGKNTEQDWLKSNLATFTRKLQGQRDLQAVCKMTLSELAPLVGAQHGIFYAAEALPSGEVTLNLLASYAYRERKHLSNQFKVGEGLVGQVLLEKERILLTDVPPDYVQIASGLGEATPACLVVLPVLFEGQVKAVIELATFQRFSTIHLTFLDQLMESLGIVINTIQTNTRTEELLKQSQSLTKELQSQQEELQQTNEELEEKAQLLSKQKVEVERKNREVEEARLSLEEKAEELTLTSKYKSEFLSNMSHELRTPLNSLLILSQQLADNPDGDLKPKQVEFASTIHASGSDLLRLINDILDLSKIESGTVTIDLSQVALEDVKAEIARTFAPIAEKRNLGFNVDIAPDLAATIQTDSTRLQQVLKNLLSNSFKFTEKGHVDLRMASATSGWSADHPSLSRAASVIAFSVSDTGIGIAADKRKIIFEAFQQADGTTSRRFGGTGLGLSISREIARILDGELRLAKSEQGAGSTFTLFLPQGDRPAKPAAPKDPEPVNTQVRRRPKAIPAAVNRAYSERPARPAAAEGEAVDDRRQIGIGDRAALIVEDDPPFAQILLATARGRDFKGVIAQRGEEALALSRQFQFSAMTLDVNLPDVDGWSVLTRLKLDPNTRHIPVHVIAGEVDHLRGLQQGAVGCLAKPVSQQTLNDTFDSMREFAERRVKALLVVEDNEVERDSILRLIGGDDVQATAVGTGAAALETLATQHYDCMVLDLTLPDMSGFDVLEEMKSHPNLCRVPVIVYTAKDLSQKDDTRLRQLAATIVVKGVHSPERLLDETSLFLHRVAANLPESKQQMLGQLTSGAALLTGKKVLVVDDDVRNLFAVCSVLEGQQMKVVTAENGKDALKALADTPDINLVLMDIMMPEMDGYETMRLIRNQPHLRSLPIVAVTAKAMKGDREACIEAGASDYIAKPVDAGQLLSLLRVWLYR